MGSRGWSFAPATDSTPATLTLSGVNITTVHEGFLTMCGIFYEGDEPLTIHLSAGTKNTIDVSKVDLSTGINCFHENKATTVDLIITGEGSLAVKGSAAGIHAYGDLIINSGNVIAEGATFGLHSFHDVIINGGTVTATGYNQAVLPYKNMSLTGVVKNFIPGVGWENVECTEGRTIIPVNTERRDRFQMEKYKKVVFSAGFNDDKDKAVVTKAPTANALYYTGKAQALVTEGTATGGTMQYALGKDASDAPEDGWAAAIPTGTEEGTYYVWYMAKGDADHKDSAAECVTVTIDKEAPGGEGVEMYRLYNPNSGEHFYTGTAEERDNLVKAGWTLEGVGFRVPEKSEWPMYRLYNPNAGDHHYTGSEEERDNLVTVGWQYEGIAFYAAGDDGTAIYRLYNPNAETGIHHYTASVEERDHLISLGWKDEGLGFYACR